LNVNKLPLRDSLARDIKKYNRTPGKRGIYYFGPVATSIWITEMIAANVAGYPLEMALPAV
jgi:hypothetical protein